MAKGGRKGAFDLSLGFIIIVIFAVILLTLGVTWLRGVFETLTPQTNDIFQKASDELQKTFQQSSQSFAIYPINYQLTRGTTLKMAAGIKNSAEDSNDHSFIINTVPVAASSQVLESFQCASFDTCTTLKDAMKSWVTVDSSSFIVLKSAYVPKPISISVPTSAPTGIYQFGFVACKADTAITQNQCDQRNPNIWGGSMQTIDLTVKA